jgi:hypothetical protein
LGLADTASVETVNVMGVPTVVVLAKLSVTPVKASDMVLLERVNSTPFRINSALAAVWYALPGLMMSLSISSSLKSKEKSEPKVFDLRESTTPEPVWNTVASATSIKSARSAYQSNASLELSELKAKIHRANVPVLEDIFLMAEMKSTIQALKKMDCTSGKSNRNMYSSTEIVLMVEMNIVERNNKIKQLENRIEEIQDKLDVFNANTEIV